MLSLIDFPRPLHFSQRFLTLCSTAILRPVVHSPAPQKSFSTIASSPSGSTLSVSRLAPFAQLFCNSSFPASLTRTPLCFPSGFCTFVLSLQKQFMKFQFKQFAWTHIALLLIVTTSQLIIRSIYEGLMWSVTGAGMEKSSLCWPYRQLDHQSFPSCRHRFLLPSCLVICNDIMAYLFGFFFGRTPLIKLSPKKTWEVRVRCNAERAPPIHCGSASLLPLPPCLRDWLRLISSSVSPIGFPWRLWLDAGFRAALCQVSRQPAFFLLPGGVADPVPA